VNSIRYLQPHMTIDYAGKRWRNGTLYSDVKVGIATDSSREDVERR